MFDLLNFKQLNGDLTIKRVEVQPIVPMLQWNLSMHILWQFYMHLIYELRSNQAPSNPVRILQL